MLSTTPMAFKDQLPGQNTKNYLRKQNMRALQVSEFGSPEVLTVNQVEKPQISDGQLLIKVAYSGINLADTYIRKGAFPGLPTPPFTLGMEGSGIIEEMGANVSGYKKGQLVAFSASQSYAEYVVVDTNSSLEWEIAVPVSLSPLAASSISMSARTAILLTQRLNNSAQKVLVHAGAGSVGSVLVQLLKAQNHEVIALVGSDQKKEYVRSLGADRVLNYKHEDVQSIIESEYPDGLDAVFNATGGNSIARDIDLLAINGHLIWFGFAESNQAPDIEAALQNAFMKSIKLELFNGGTHSQQDNISAIKSIENLILDGKIEISSHHIYSLEEGVNAHRDLESGNTVGKLTLQI
ncbi:zinc-binding alcohol dehydrogenase family protein [Vibrio sp. Isolate34]|uniref:quinone oxidoreductase family protein n=1 Tax=Vibrio sp. Isolate34 TaxID=2908540 RepID=UPI001EFCCBE9|nr:zinc-binding alcohol dehydrogenase family protein [Vibrio sp. Isolate34]MCG9641324.1 zinc-binding alcohol dehydrogenase family protein [Vibrio sp. Isolate34]